MLHCLALETPYVGKTDLDARKLSVETSMDIDLPPHLIISSASIKLLETIGQGMSVPTFVSKYC